MSPPKARAETVQRTSAARNTWRAHGPVCGAFSAQNLWHMRQFFEAYRDDPLPSAAPRVMHGDAATSVFNDADAVEFLSLPADHCEADLRLSFYRVLDQ